MPICPVGPTVWSRLQRLRFARQDAAQRLLLQQDRPIQATLFSVKSGSATMSEANSTETRPEAEPAPAADAAANGDRITQLEAEVVTLKDQLLRAIADGENMRRRAEREREDTAKYAISRFAKELLAVADNLRRAVESVPSEARQAAAAVDTLLTGVEATERQLLAAFERGGIQKQDPSGQPFDPNFHQVVMELDGTGKPAGTVVQVLQAGYTINGRLLREAMVGVAKGPADAPAHRVDTMA